MKLIKDRVRELITKSPHLKDDDDKLIATVWWYDIKCNKEMTAKQFLDRIANGSLTNPESIRRSRAKLQQDEPELRGNSYKGRQAEGERFKSELL
jgi:hypothetical protein